MANRVTIALPPETADDRRPHGDSLRGVTVNGVAVDVRSVRWDISAGGEALVTLVIPAELTLDRPEALR